MAILGDIAKKTDLAGDAHLRQDGPGAIDRIAAFESIEPVWNAQIMKGFGRRWCVLPQLAVVQVEHTHREQQHERADEEPEVQMKIAKPSVDQCVLRENALLVVVTG